MSDLVRADVHADLERLNLELDEAESTRRLPSSTRRMGDVSQPRRSPWTSRPSGNHSTRRSTSIRATTPSWRRKDLRERIFEFVMHCRTPVFLMTIVASPIYSFLPGLRRAAA